MKFCTKCGAELVEEAVICTKCGCMVVEEQAATVKEAKARTIDFLNVGERAPSMLLPIFNFVFAVLAAVALFFVVLAFGAAHIETRVLSYSGNIYAYYCPDSGFVVASIVFSVFALAFGVLCFVMTLVQKLRGESLFSGILKLVLGVMLLLATVCLAL